jgi:hypothetical protein
MVMISLARRIVSRRVAVAALSGLGVVSGAAAAAVTGVDEQPLHRPAVAVTCVAKGTTCTATSDVDNSAAFNSPDKIWATWVRLALCESSTTADDPMPIVDTRFNGVWKLVRVSHQYLTVQYSSVLCVCVCVTLCVVAVAHREWHHLLLSFSLPPGIHFAVYLVKERVEAWFRGCFMNAPDALLEG